VDQQGWRPGDEPDGGRTGRPGPDPGRTERLGPDAGRTERLDHGTGGAEGPGADRTARLDPAADAPGTARLDPAGSGHADTGRLDQEGHGAGPDTGWGARPERTPAWWQRPKLLLACVLLFALLTFLLGVAVGVRSDDAERVAELERELQRVEAQRDAEVAAREGLEDELAAREDRIAALEQEAAESAALLEQLRDEAEGEQEELLAELEELRGREAEVAAREAELEQRAAELEARADEVAQREAELERRIAENGEDFELPPVEDLPDDGIVERVIDAIRDLFGDDGGEGDGDE
jgi:hypothetical protein